MWDGLRHSEHSQLGGAGGVGEPVDVLGGGSPVEREEDLGCAGGFEVADQAAEIRQGEVAGEQLDRTAQRAAPPDLLADAPHALADRLVLGGCRWAGDMPAVGPSGGHGPGALPGAADHLRSSAHEHYGFARWPSWALAMPRKNQCSSCPIIPGNERRPTPPAHL